MLKQIRPALVILGLFSIITGILYPALITGAAQIIFPAQSNGSLIVANGQVVGSVLIGQQFDQAQYFWGRPSDTTLTPYNASASGGSNYSVLNPNLQKEVETRLAALKAVDPQNNSPVPVDLVTSSGSGLDPDISVAAAEYQAARVARVRGISLTQVETLIAQNTHPRILGFLGEPTVNVLELNLAVDKLQ